MSEKKKVAVLGGGIGSLSAVYELLKADQFKGNYEVTVYQMGWRIGGKGASGRQHMPNPDNPTDPNQRILEHGLHAWFGWYSNAFNQFKDCYTHLGWGEEHRFNTWDKAFTPEDNVVVMENIGDQWMPYEVTVPAIPGEPGGQEELLTVHEYLELLIKKIHDHFHETDLGKKYASPSPAVKESWWQQIKHWLAKMIGKVVVAEAGFIIKELLKLMEANANNIRKHDHPVHSEIVRLIDQFLHWLHNELGEAMGKHFETKRIFTLIDLGLAICRGLIQDKVLVKGLNCINDVDFKEWVLKHGAAPVSAESVWVRTVYDCCFAYRKGMKQYPDIEAGVALRICFGIALGSKGHWLWKMNAGMGDTIFSPYYFALKKLGVKFEFFQKVKELKLSADKQSVAEIRMERQASLKPEYEATGYQPSFFFNHVDCWPSEPFYDQLVEGEELKRLADQGRNVNLESFYSEWPGCRDEAQRFYSLRKTDASGAGDFDLVILGIPVAAHVHIAPELLEQNPQWMNMVENVQTNQTFATQLWMKKSASELGWKFDASSLTAFWEPIDTYCDMTHLLEAENWAPPTGPKNIAYLVGPYPETQVIPPHRQHNFPFTMNENIRKESIEYLKDYIKWIYPNAMLQNGQFDWDELVDLLQKKGEARFESQYWRVNVDPWERYTLSVKGTSAHRLRADQSGFSNLFFTGDWIDNGVNVGCIEATVISGMRAAAAISGKNIPVIGDNGLYQLE
jgi:uncharacterized protein with NAD-binding domain and iron-sulfur cluster